MLEKTIIPQHLSSTPEDPVEAINQIYVGIVTSHLLVAHYLCDLIKINTNLVPVILGDRAKNATVFPSDAKTIVLIDLWGLPLPTSEYLDHFTVAIPKCAF